MKTVTVKIPAKKITSYPIKIGKKLLAHPESWLTSESKLNRIVIITDNTVKKYHEKSLLRALKKRGHTVFVLSFAGGEKNKTDKTKQYLEKQMLKQHCDRDTLILALGGGIVGDMAGYVAATYMRGISYIQIPTTFLAMVDSSVGGKTGINTDQGKNLIGAFWQPKAVIIDVDCLQTLPKKQLTSGLIESIKMFLTSDKKSFLYLRKNLSAILQCEEKILIDIINRSVKIKSTIVEQDEKENNQRMILNFGHTIGHALEKISLHNISHGYAVALGILVESKISQLLGLLSQEDFLTIQSLLSLLDIHGHHLSSFHVDSIIRATQHDKKVKSGKARYVLLTKIGAINTEHHSYAHPVSDKIVKQAFLHITREPAYARK